MRGALKVTFAVIFLLIYLNTQTAHTQSSNFDIARPCDCDNSCPIGSKSFIRLSDYLQKAQTIDSHEIIKHQSSMDDWLRQRGLTDVGEQLRGFRSTNTIGRLQTPVPLNRVGNQQQNLKVILPQGDAARFNSQDEKASLYTFPSGNGMVPDSLPKMQIDGLSVPSQLVGSGEGQTGLPLAPVGGQLGTFGAPITPGSLDFERDVLIDPRLQGDRNFRIDSELLEEIVLADVLGGDSRVDPSVFESMLIRDPHCTNCIPQTPSPGGGEILSALNYTNSQKVALNCKSYVGLSTDEQAKTCTAAVANLCSSMSKCTYEEIMLRLTKSSEETAATYRDRLRIYDSTCMKKNVETASIDRDYVEHRSGVLMVNAKKASSNQVCRAYSDKLKASDQVFCSAAIISKNYVSTAQHCFFDNRTGQTNEAKTCLDIGAIEFRSFAQPDKAVALETIVDENKRLQHQGVDGDYVFVRTALEILDDQGQAIAPTPYEGLEIYKPTVVGAYHNLAVPWFDSTNPSFPMWRRKVRFSDQSCAPIRFSKTCFITKCQTLSGFSGAPFWTVHENPVTNQTYTALIGHQSQGGLEGVSACQFPPRADVNSVKDGNIATRPPAYDVLAVQ